MIDERRVQGPDQLLRDTHRRREALRQAMADLEAAIAKPVPGRAKEWSATVTRALGGIGTALREHVAANECDDGLFDQVIETQPRLTHIVALLRQDHVDMAAAVVAMLHQLEGASNDETTAEHVREHAVALLSQLARHRHAGADLLYTAYSVDISAAD